MPDFCVFYTVKIFEILRIRLLRDKLDEKLCMLLISFKINSLLNKLRKNEKQVKFRLRESFYLNVSVKIRPFSISLSKVRKKIISMLQRYFFNF